MKQETRVLMYLEQNGSITSWQAIMELHITRLAAVICKLRKKDRNIITTIKTDKDSRWAEYTLKEEPLPTAIENGSEERGKWYDPLPSEDITN